MNPRKKQGHEKGNYLNRGRVSDGNHNLSGNLDTHQHPDCPTHWTIYQNTKKGLRMNKNDRGEKFEKQKEAIRKLIEARQADEMEAMRASVAKMDEPSKPEKLIYETETLHTTITERQIEAGIEPKMFDALVASMINEGWLIEYESCTPMFVEHELGYTHVVRFSRWVTEDTRLLERKSHKVDVKGYDSWTMLPKAPRDKS
ncbi:MAG: hypothetical protein ACFE0Q_20640 [Anaerolineae bacterium]